MDSVPDNLDKAQQLIGRSLEASRHYSVAQTEIAKALALIDIGRSLRAIYDEIYSWETYGLNIKKHTL